MSTPAIIKSNYSNVLNGERTSSVVDYLKEIMAGWKSQEGTKSFSISRAQIEKILCFLETKNCEVVNKLEIKKFFEKHSGVIDYLYEVPDIIFEYFENTQLKLELFFDPDVENDEGELFLNIETNLSPQEEHEKLKQIDESWLLNIINEDMIFFNLNLKFI